jgi:hypothetical protein
MSARVRPDFVALEKAARRERAEAVHRLLVKPLIDLFRPIAGFRISAPFPRSAHVQGRPSQG